MILADKIINERKKNGWSQEELAEQLSVSRQSVSKWEGAQAVPDLQKILKMAELFGVSTDYLLKDDMEPADQYMQEEVPGDGVTSSAVSKKPVRKVSMEEANDFLKVEKNTAPKIANAVSMCIISPALLIFLAGLSEAEGAVITENMAAGIGIITLLGLVAAAVYCFIVCGAATKPYEFLGNEEFETEYGVIGMVTQKKKEFESTHTSLIALGVVLCIVSVLPLIAVSIMKLDDYVIVAMVSLLLIIVAVGVNMIIRAGSIMGGYDKLLQENDYTASQKRAGKRNSAIASIYWGIATAIYLGWSFVTMRWKFTWIIWPVAGVLYGVVAAVVSIAAKDTD